VDFFTVHDMTTWFAGYDLTD